MDISNFVVLVEVNTQKYCAVSLELSQNSAVSAKKYIRERKTGFSHWIGVHPINNSSKTEVEKRAVVGGPLSPNECQRL